MEFNSQEYIKGQIDKQYIQPKESRFKTPFDYSSYPVDEDTMEKVIGRNCDELRNMVGEGELTYAEIVKCFWNQAIKTKDYNAVISLNEEAVKQAEALTYDASHDVLYGMPVLIKDNINAVGLPTTAGAAVLKDNQADEDAELVRLLKEKGAIILGKANLSEWANFMSTDSSNGYSTIGGQTKNLFGQFDVGGSSSGSAAAVALNITPVAIGTETAGSIIYPASQNGIVGLKPTLGLVSQEGIIPVSKTHDTAGPMANTVKDTYDLFKAISQTDAVAEWAVEAADLKIGIIENDSVKSVYRGEDAQVLEVLSKRLKQAGAACEAVTLLEDAFEVDYVPILKFEFDEGVRDFFKGIDKGLTLSDVIAFNERDLENTAPYNQELLVQSAETDVTRQSIEEHIQSNQKKTRAALETAFEEVDVLVTLSNYATVLYAASGYPAVTLPGFKRTTGEPVGITLIGKSGEDVHLLEIAHALESFVY